MATRNKPRSLQTWGLALVLLLALVGWLQYRWIGALSQADRERATLGIERAAAGFTRDFDRVISRVALGLLPPTGMSLDDATLVERHRQWQRAAAYPELIRGLFVRDAGPAEGWRLWNAVDGAWQPTSLPAPLRALEGRSLAALLSGPRAAFHRNATTRRAGRDRGNARGAELWNLQPFRGDIPALILPIRVDFGRLRAPRTRPRLLVVWLDRAVLVDQLFPDLASRYFATTTDEPFRLTVVDQSEPTTVLFRAGLPAEEVVPPSSAVAMPFGRLLTLATLGEAEVTRWAPDPAGAGTTARPGPRGRRPLLYEGLSRASEPRWTLLAEHPGGSVDEAVQRARRRNLSLSLGVLGVLAAALALQWIATRRLQRVARQQLDFVAGVTHELRTPVAAMRVAGQNLAEGVVREPEKVRRYGALVEQEGQRLTVMIEQVLAFAGIQAGKRSYRRDRVDVRDVIDRALAEMKPALDEADMTVDLAIADDPPPIRGDATALTQALRNLIENAVKYAADGGRLDIAVVVPATRTARPVVDVAISDHGPGVATRDHERIFEPFVRGEQEDGGIGHAGGSGLGLSLVRDIVEGHGGNVSVASTPGDGSTFTLRLPAETEDESA